MLDWEKRVAALWSSIDEYGEEPFVERIDGLAAELPAGSAIADFERACARDSTGHADSAMPLYLAALETGLIGERRRLAVIQMSNSLRKLGRAQEAAALLAAELELGEDALSGAARAFLAFALVDLGREREAASLALAALAEYLPRYKRSVARYAEALLPERKVLRRGTNGVSSGPSDVAEGRCRPYSQPSRGR